MTCNFATNQPLSVLLCDHCLNVDKCNEERHGDTDCPTYRLVEESMDVG